MGHKKHRKKKGKQDKAKRKWKARLSREADHIPNQAQGEQPASAPASSQEERSGGIANGEQGASLGSRPSLEHGAPEPTPYPAALVTRYLDSLELQLRAKDDQIRALDERLQDAFEMQRALALLIKAYEKRSGLAADLLWNEVPEEAMHPRTREAESRVRPSAEGPQNSEATGTGAPAPAPAPPAPEPPTPRTRDEQAAEENTQPAPVGTQPPSTEPAAFSAWLRRTRSN